MPPDAAVFTDFFIDMEETSNFKGQGRPSATNLKTLDENDCTNQSTPTTLTSVDDLEVSLGKSTPFQQKIASSPHHGTSSPTSKDELTSSLSKSKTPVVICTDESIDVKYHIYYERELGRGTNTIIYKA